MLVTYQQLKTYLGIATLDTSQDAVLTQLATQADMFIRNYINRPKVESASCVDVINYPYRLNTYPITAVTSVVDEDLVTIPSTDYELDTNNGILRLDDDIYTGKLTVTYTGGYASVPADLTYVACRIASQWFNLRKADGITSESLEGVNVTMTHQFLTDELKAILDKYKRII